LRRTGARGNGARRRYTPKPAETDPMIERFLIRLGIALVVLALGGFGAYRGSHSSNSSRDRDEDSRGYTEEEANRMKANIEVRRRD
jgi:hypothetical protein